MTRGADRLRVRTLDRLDYQDVWDAMRQFVDERTAATLDEFWVLEHFPVFTLGQAADPEHILVAGDIPVVRSDRGGQVTYHGPGQLVIYLMVDLKRKEMGPKALVRSIEKAIIELLKHYGVAAEAVTGMPGVYVDGRKIASLGLRVRRGCSFHGLSLNVAMDLEPFLRINPCGIRDLEMTQLADLGIAENLVTVGQRLTEYLAAELGYAEVTACNEPFAAPAPGPVAKGV